MLEKGASQHHRVTNDACCNPGMTCTCVRLCVYGFVDILHKMEHVSCSYDDIQKLITSSSRRRSWKGFSILHCHVMSCAAGVCAGIRRTDDGRLLSTAAGSTFIWGHFYRSVPDSPACPLISIRFQLDVSNKCCDAHEH